MIDDSETDRRLAEAERGRAEALRRLAEADETLRALRQGEVDGPLRGEGTAAITGDGGRAATTGDGGRAAIAGDGGPASKVFTLSGEDRPYRMFVENMRDGAATVSDEGVVLYANARLAAILERPLDHIVGSPIDLILADAFDDLLSTAAGPTGAVETNLAASGGRAVPVLMGTSELDVDGDRMTCLTFTDLTAQKIHDDGIGGSSRAQIAQLQALREAQAALTEKATHDALTGLPNRALFIDRVGLALARSFRTGRWTAVLLVDIDRFKHINDSRGHDTGDLVLRQIAERLLAATRSMDTVGRIGGDEFVVLAEDLADEIEAVHVAGRLAASLGQGFDGVHDGDAVTASIGISLAEAGAATAEAMVHEADTAMYHAKSQGRNRSEVFDVALSRRVTQRAATEASLRRALDEHRVTPYYQPIVDLSCGAVAGFEALARILQPASRVLTPDAFISVAEERGLVVPLGAQMLAAACRDARRWHESAQPSRLTTVAVNLSPRQLERSDLTGELRLVLVETGLAPELLHLEITETALIELRPEVVHQLHRVRDLGVEVGLDDFGTGYASLTHLRHLPVTFVKIDRSFISGLGADIQDERIVAAVIELTANLGLRSVAEGIETPQQLDRLRELGCNHAQGYLFARPAPTAEPNRSYCVVGADYATA